MNDKATGQSVGGVEEIISELHERGVKSGKEESERVFSEEKVEMTADLPPGAYPYICGPHGEQEGMRGTLKIVP